MRKNLSYFLILTFVFSFLGCTTKKTLTTIPLAAPVSEEIVDDVSMLDQDSLYQSGLATQDSLISAYFEQQINTYKPSATREQDLLHIKLDLKFDWQQQRVLGKAWLTLKPFFYSSDVVMLDAKGFTIAAVTLADKNIPLKYDYDNKVLTIHLDKTYEPTEEYKLFIDYIAKPSERQDVAGSAAITSNQGLFFINHDGKDKDKPMQIWTQGETEHNSRWFPTIDKPNERCTQEMLLTVEDKFKTLSNGLLKSSTKNSDGTRSDYWVMDMPHAPYLFMVAVGEYSIVKDTWEGKDILYYVEPEYEQDARAIFANTTEMLQFFSDKLGVKYPWQKYAEIVVRDYVSGAMENTTAVIFGEFVQKHKNELSGVGNDLVVAHELFHHWFGDYVTCESWSNLTLNEGFANYSEYLWFEHKYGADEANAHLVNEQQGYFASARGGVHPLIFYHYADKEDMFDAHSYNKGGCVLHMLRNYLGDKAFFTALNRYLTKNAFTAVEADELRQAFEDVSGKDLKWFFDQWFLSAGHPKLAVKTYYDTNTGEAVVQLKQDQESFVEPPIFILPMAVDIYLEDSGTPTRQQIMMTKKEETFRFKTNKRPKLINVDADKVLLCEKFEEKSTEEWIFQYKHAKNYIDRYQALQGLQIDNNQEVIK
nr:M1 family metallopeptidase [Saprospiraceae bacterium]